MRAIRAAVLTAVAAIIAAVAGPTAAQADPGPGPGYHTYTYRNVHSGLCLEIDNWNTADGTRATQNTCTGADNQQWTLSWFHNPTAAELVNVHSGKCLDVIYSRTTDLAEVGQNPCDGRASQRWVFQLLARTSDVWTFPNVGSGRCLDVRDFSRAGDATIQQYACHQTDNQQWIEIAHYHLPQPPPVGLPPAAPCPAWLCP